MARAEAKSVVARRAGDVLSRRVHMKFHMRTLLPSVITLFLVVTGCSTGPDKASSSYTPLFNGTDLTGWRGGDTFDHRKWQAMPEAERTAKNAEWTADMRKH